MEGRGSLIRPLSGLGDAATATTSTASAAARAVGGKLSLRPSPPFSLPYPRPQSFMLCRFLVEKSLDKDSRRYPETERCYQRAAQIPTGTHHPRRLHGVQAAPQRAGEASVAYKNKRHELGAVANTPEGHRQLAPLAAPFAAAAFKSASPESGPAPANPSSTRADC